MTLGSAESKHPGLTNGEIIFGRISTYAITIPQRHGHADGRTDGQTTYRARQYGALRINGIYIGNCCLLTNRLVNELVKLSPNRPIVLPNRPNRSPNRPALSPNHLVTELVS